MTKDFVFELSKISPSELATLHRLLIDATAPKPSLTDDQSLWLIVLLSRIVMKWPFKGDPSDMVSYGKLHSKQIVRLFKALVPEVAKAVKGGAT